VSLFAILLGVLADASVATVSLEGWVVVASPNGEQLRCANGSEREWRVFLDAGAVRVARDPPALPFREPPGVIGRRHVLAVDGGWQLGADAGEFGGGLWSITRSHEWARKLGRDNVHAILPLTSERVRFRRRPESSRSRARHRAPVGAAGEWRLEDGRAR
jgi:hypothetical protein